MIFSFHVMSDAAKKVHRHHSRRHYDNGIPILLFVF